MKKFNFILLSVLILSLVLIVLSSCLYFLSDGNVPVDYGITIDAGSSKTKFFLYDWSSVKKNETGFVNERASQKLKIEIANYANDLTKPFIKTLDEFSNQIEYTRKGFETPVYLGATAGLRLLKAVNAESADKILKTIRNIFTQYIESQKKLKVQGVEIISGEKEGLYCWISTNYLMGHVPTAERPMNSTVGILDMGGASAQIGFEASCKGSHDCNNGKERTTIIANEKTRLFGIDYNIYTFSNLCFGNDNARRRYQYILIMHSDSKKEVYDPCTHPGQLNRTITKAQILKDVCTSNDKTKATLNHENYTIIAKPDIDKCLNYTLLLVDSEFVGQNFINSQEEIKFKIMEESPPKELTFYALSTYYYSVSQLIKNKSDEIRFDDEDHLVREIKDYCSRDWDQIVKGANDQQIEYLHNYCFALNYIYNYLKHVHKFADKHFNKIEFREKLNGHSLGWSLGYMLQATNTIPQGGPEDPVLNKTQFVTLLILGLILLAGVFFAFFNEKSNRNGVDSTSSKVEFCAHGSKAG